MKKALNITERTLEKEKKSFVETCVFWQGACVAILIIMVIACIGLIGNLITDFTVSNLLYSISDIISAVICIIALNFGATIFKKLKISETPFLYDIADKIKGAGLILIWGNVAIFAIETIINIVIGYLSEAGTIVANETFNFSFDLTALLVGGTLLMIAYIFNYGCKLQQESDETV